MIRFVIVVRTANRPEILNRCIATAINGCDVARAAHWIVLDDSSQNHLPQTREIARFWKEAGLQLSYVDKSVENEIRDSLPRSTFLNSFELLTRRSPSCRSEGGRNLGLMLGLSLNSSFLCFVDDDMVHHHAGNCFFHWLGDNRHSNSFIAAPRKSGIADMSYLHRLATVLDRNDWTRFVSDTGFSSDMDFWFSPENPFWEPHDEESDGASVTVWEPEAVSGQFMVLHNKGAEWFPFPSEYNSDFNWSLLQSACVGTSLLKVGGVDVQHLPPAVGHLDAESIVSELVGTAVMGALRQIKSSGKQTMNTLAIQFPDVFGAKLKQELFLFMNAERAILSRIHTHGDLHVDGRLSKIENTLKGVAERLKTIDSRQLTAGWLEDFNTRARVFLELRCHEQVQNQFRRALLTA
jgi:hypothetical protein